MKKEQFDELLESVHEGGAILRAMTPTPETPKPRSILWMIAHDEWCSHDEADDGVECDCHLSVIASLRKRPEWAELLAAGKAWAETMTGDNPAYSTRARRLYRAIRALAQTKGFGWRDGKLYADDGSVMYPKESP